MVMKRRPDGYLADSPYERCIELPDGMIICVVKSAKQNTNQTEPGTATVANQEAPLSPLAPTVLQRLNPFRLLRQLWRGLRRKSLAKS